VKLAAVSQSDIDRRPVPLPRFCEPRVDGASGIVRRQRVVEQLGNRSATAIVDRERIEVFRRSCIRVGGAKRLDARRRLETEIATTGREVVFAPAGESIRSDGPVFLGYADRNERLFDRDRLERACDSVASFIALGAALLLEEVVDGQVGVAEWVLPARFVGIARVQRLVEVVGIGSAGVATDTDVKVVVVQHRPVEVDARSDVQGDVDSGGCERLFQFVRDPDGRPIAFGGEGDDRQRELVDVVSSYEIPEALQTAAG